MPKKLTKMEKRAKQIVANEQKERRAERNKKVTDYIEMKMIRGYTREQASKMARDLIDNQG